MKKENKYLQDYKDIQYYIANNRLCLNCKYKIDKDIPFYGRQELMKILDISTNSLNTLLSMGDIRYYVERRHRRIGVYENNLPLFLHTVIVRTPRHAEAAEYSLIQLRKLGTLKHLIKEEDK
jgi:hypothetical protein